MTAHNFIEKYNLHDSLIDTVNYNQANATVNLQIDFAFWMQSWYTEKYPETGTINVVFRSVKAFNCPSDVDWSPISILRAVCEGETIKIFLMNDMTDDCFEMAVDAADVEVLGLN